MKWIRKEVVSEARERYGSVIFAFWHNRFFFNSFAYRQIQDKNNVVVMISRSRDGEFLGALLESFQYKTVRGSTSRGGEEAVRQLSRLLKSGFDGCITPDGPRGPLYKVQPGVIMLSYLTGKPIVPVTYLTKRHIRLKSWDGFYIPIPFSRGAIIFSEPIIVKMDADEEQRLLKGAELEERLLSLNREVEELVFGKGTQSTV